jgi:hypothetical protein
LSLQTVISKDQYSEWKHNPVTKQLFNDLQVAVLDQQSYEYPNDIDATVCMAHQREGAIMLLEELTTWEPESVKKGESDD